MKTTTNQMSPSVRPSLRIVGINARTKTVGSGYHQRRSIIIEIEVVSDGGRTHDVTIAKI